MSVGEVFDCLCLASAAAEVGVGGEQNGGDCADEAEDRDLLFLADVGTEGNGRCDHSADERDDLCGGKVRHPSGEDARGWRLRGWCVGGVGIAHP